MSEPIPPKYKVTIHFPHKVATGTPKTISAETPAEYRKNTDPSTLTSHVYEIAEGNLPKSTQRPAALKNPNAEKESTGFHYLLTGVPCTEGYEYMVPPKTKAWTDADINYMDLPIQNLLKMKIKKGEDVSEICLYYLGEDAETK
jgi:hypothetical protein